MQVLLVLHGSPDPAYARAAEALMRAWRQYAPESHAVLCFLEGQSPLLGDLLSQCQAEVPVCVVPLFLNRGRHVRRDIPQLAAGRNVRVSEPLLAADVISEVMRARLRALPVTTDHLLLYSHGSRGDTETVAGLAEALHARQACPVEVVLANEGEQGLSEALARAAAAGAARPVILPHFLLPGRWQQRLQAHLATLRRSHAFEKVEIAAPLGEHPAMISLIEARIRQCRERI